MADPGRYLLAHQDRIYSCELVPGSRNRNICIRVKPLAPRPGEEGFWHTLAGGDDRQLNLFVGGEKTTCQIRVSFPNRISRARVLRVIEDHAEWIREQYRRLHRLAAKQAANRLGTGTVLYHRGRKLQLVVLNPTPFRRGIFLRDSHLLCYVETGGSRTVRQILENWYRRETEKLIDNRIRRLALGLTERDFVFKVRSQKSRWGSCSEQGQLNFNWRLAMAPDYVLEYLIVHELAHLEELNHSPRYWRLVHRHGSRVKQARLWLKRNSARLDVL